MSSSPLPSFPAAAQHPRIATWGPAGPDRCRLADNPERTTRHALTLDRSAIPIRSRQLLKPVVDVIHTILMVVMGAIFMSLPAIDILDISRYTITTRSQ